MLYFVTILSSSKIMKHDNYYAHNNIVFLLRLGIDSLLEQYYLSSFLQPSGNYLSFNVFVKYLSLIHIFQS